MTIIAQKQSGFTLVETLLALTIFGFILLVAYQALESSVQAKVRVVSSVEQQNQLRLAHRTLTNVFDSGAELSGDNDSVEIDLSSGDSPWLEGVKRISLVISEDQTLWAGIDGGEVTKLLEMPGVAEFGYLDGGIRQVIWQGQRRPTGVELRWLEGGELRRWQFQTR